VLHLPGKYADAGTSPHFQKGPCMSTQPNVFVAGGTSGINLAIAQSFAATGAKVGVLSRDATKVESAVKSLEAIGGAGSAAGWSADVRNYDDVAAALRSFHERFGDIDVLISGAAGNFVAPALGMSPNGFRSVIDIDLIGTFHVLHASHAFLRKPGASLINISATQAFVPMMMQSHVCAAKAGIDMLTRTLAMEWARDGIRINSIAPGPVADTEGMARLAPTPEIAKQTTSRIPAGRWARKDEIAAIAHFLASPAAAMLTGQVIPVDGGLSLGSYSPEANAQMDAVMAMSKAARAKPATKGA
jgi:NAD(P)-dependent dehydrogenase (short-subunit alcohol dehydrogenase family)